MFQEENFDKFQKEWEEKIIVQLHEKRVLGGRAGKMGLMQFTQKLAQAAWYLRPPYDTRCLFTRRLPSCSVLKRQIPHALSGVSPNAFGGGCATSSGCTSALAFLKKGRSEPHASTMDFSWARIFSDVQLLRPADWSTRNATKYTSSRSAKVFTTR